MKLEDLFEVFNYQHPDIKWYGDIARFTINDQLYEATVRPARSDEQETLKPFFNDFKNIKVDNIDFAAILPDNTRTQELTGLAGPSAAKVIATVIQVSTLLQQRHNYDILLAVAKQKDGPAVYRKRAYMYSKVAEVLGKRTKMSSIDLVDTMEESVSVVFKPMLLDGIEAIRQHLLKVFRDKLS